MRAIRPMKSGGSEVLTISEVPMPEAGDGEVLIRVEAAGVNPFDVNQRNGLLETTGPIPMGSEGAGVIEALGPGVTDLVKGQRVAWASVSGSYAAYIAAPADRVAPVPEGIDAKRACAAMVQGLMAHALTRSVYPLKRGDTCLVFAAASTQNGLICQMAKRVGAIVLGVLPDGSKRGDARDLGVEHILLSDQPDIGGEIRRLTDGRGVDVVYDSVGRNTHLFGMQCAKNRGTVVFFGASSGPVPKIDVDVLAKASLFVTRPKLRDYLASKTELRERAAELFQWMVDGAVKVHIDATFPLAAARLAHDRLEGKGAVGKLVLLP